MEVKTVLQLVLFLHILTVNYPLICGNLAATIPIDIKGYSFNLSFFPGVLSHKAVREKIVRAFLIEEQKIVMKVLKAQGKKSSKE